MNRVFYTIISAGTMNATINAEIGVAAVDLTIAAITTIIVAGIITV